MQWDFFLPLLGRIVAKVNDEPDGVYHVTLEINDVKPEDGGQYKVNAKNASGETNANIKLNLDGRLKFFSLRGTRLNKT